MNHMPHSPTRKSAPRGSAGLADQLEALCDEAMGFVSQSKVEALALQWLKGAQPGDAGDRAAQAALALGLAGDLALSQPSLTGQTAFDRLARAPVRRTAEEAAALALLRRSQFRAGRIGRGQLHDMASGEALPLDPRTALPEDDGQDVFGRFAPAAGGRWVLVSQPIPLDEDSRAVVLGFVRPGGRGLSNPLRCAEAVYRHLVRSGGFPALAEAASPLPFDPANNPMDALASAWAEQAGAPDEAARDRARALTSQPRLVDALTGVVIARNAGHPRLSDAYRAIAALMIETMVRRTATGSARRDLDEVAAHLADLHASGRHPPDIRALFETLRREAMPATGSASGGDTDLDRLVQRIQALRAKTVEQGCTEQEAMAAAEKVAELLDRYGLTLTELDLRRQACEGIGVETGRKRRGPIDDCIPAIAQFFDCRVWGEHTPSGTLRYIFFGLPSDVQAALYLHDLIALAFATETARFQADDFYRATHTSQRRTATNSFQIGLARGIIGKLDALQRARDAARRSGSGKDLVPVKDSIIDAEMAKLGLMLRRVGGGGRRSVIRDAYDAGQEAGAKFEYQPGIARG